MNFMEALENSQESITENGAIGFKTTGHKLVDLNFAIPSFRAKIDKDLFEQALKQDEKLTLKWLLYLRDIRKGVGERSSFRSFIKYLVQINHQLAKKFLEVVLIEEYGRWDDYVALLDIKDEEIVRIIGRKLKAQLLFDMADMNQGKSISLLAKWLPSENASSTKTKKRARKMMDILRISSKDYRKCLSQLRKYLNVVEVKMSANEWNSIDYNTVPSKANLIYRDAFYRHDKDRRLEYINSLQKGEAKINAQAMFLHDIVSHYNLDGNIDNTLEAMWQAQEKLNGFGNTLVVRDGSGSMLCSLDKTTVTILDVANAITLYCAENNEGAFKDKFITFSRKAKLVDLSNKHTLLAKLRKLSTEDECTNTSIGSVFSLILRTMKENNLPQEDMPQTILIVSDMEFDPISMNWSDKIFKVIKDKFSEAGYQLPKLVFWNIASRTNTIPITQNKNGVILVSGFSRNLMEMVMSSELDSYKALIQVLNTSRYGIIDEIYK